MSFNFPNAPTLFQQFSPTSGPTYYWDGVAWKFVSNKFSFLTRAAFVTYVASSPVYQAGAVVSAAGFFYLAIAGSTVISDLHGFIPLGEVHVEHFGAKGDMTFDPVHDFGSGNTGTNLGPLKTAGTDDLAAFQAADDYVTSTGVGDFYAEADGYFLNAQLVLAGRLISRRSYRNVLWLRNSNVYKSNIWINSSIGGIVGFTIIDQYDYSVTKPASNGQMGCGITVAQPTNSQGGPSIYSTGTQTIITDIEIDCRFCRAGNGGGQTSKGSYHVFIGAGVEFSRFTLAPTLKTNIISNGLVINHWGMKYHDGDPFTDWGSMVIEETYHCCECSFSFPEHFDFITNPHGFQAFYESSSGGANIISDISVKGCIPLILQPGDAVDNWTNERQKNKIMKGMKIGFITSIDAPLGGFDTRPGGLTWPYHDNVVVRGFGQVQLNTDKYTDVDRNRVRQIKVDIAFKGITMVRTSSPKWSARGVYVQGCVGKVDLGTVVSFGLGRGVDFEYCDGDQVLNYVKGDGCIVYVFSRGGRFYQTTTDRDVAGYVEDPADGGYRPGTAAGTRAVYVAGGSYSTVVNTQSGAKTNTTTKTYITPFGGADDDVYEGTPIKIGTHWVTATEFIQGQSGGGVITSSIQGITKANPGVINSDNHNLSPGVSVAISGVVGMTQINGLIGVVTVIDDDHFTMAVNTTSFSTYVSGGSVTPQLPGVPYLVHTPLRVPATNGQAVLVDEFTRMRHLSLTSSGSESALYLSNAGVDDLDMHGLRSAGKYGANMINGRITLRGPLPLTVGRTSAADNYTVNGDSTSLFSMSDGTILSNPDVAYHFIMAKDVGTGSQGHVDLRNCRIEDIDTLVSGADGTLRYCLTMTGCVDYDINQLLSHPGRQGNGSNGYFNYGEDGKLECWHRGLATAADGTVTWTFPGNFSGGASSVVVHVEVQTLAATSIIVTTGSSTSCFISILPAGVHTINVRAIGRWFAE